MSNLASITCLPHGSRSKLSCRLARGESLRNLHRVERGALAYVVRGDPEGQAALQRSVETGDAKPTDGAYKVFEELSRELEGHLATLEGLLGQELESVNSKLKSEGMEPVTRTPN